jgi:hypothetical protein
VTWLACVIYMPRPSHVVESKQSSQEVLKKVHRIPRSHWCTKRGSDCCTYIEYSPSLCWKNSATRRFWSRCIVIRPKHYHITPFISNITATNINFHVHFTTESHLCLWKIQCWWRSNTWKSELQLYLPMWIPAIPDAIFSLKAWNNKNTKTNLFYIKIFASERRRLTGSPVFACRFDGLSIRLTSS